LISGTFANFIIAASAALVIVCAQIIQCILQRRRKAGRRRRIVAAIIGLLMATEYFDKKLRKPTKRKRIGLEAWMVLRGERRDVRPRHVRMKESRL
jgi:hypothetical protein